MRALAWLLGLSLLIVSGAAAQRAAGLSGMSGDEIKALQQRLAAVGCYQGVIDGQASPALTDAITTCPSQDPILRIETGMHLALINAIGTDRACQIAATASDDKTVRVWSLPEGRLLRTLRVPIGAGDGGKMSAIAVSPDGRWIAAGGWDALDDISQEDFVDIFDTATGTVVARVGPFGGPIHKLTFSPDGRWLAALSGDQAGLKVIDSQTWQIVAEDQDHVDQSEDAAFGPDGRLYTVADDGKLRRYGPGPTFAKERQVTTQGSRHAFSVAVDPSGQLVAVGFGDSAKVDVYDAAALQFRFAADTKAIDNGDLGSLVWSHDGTRLFAGGGYHVLFQGNWKFALLTFDRNGRHVGKPLPLANGNIEDLQLCGDLIAVAARDPAFGLIAADNHVALWKTSVAPDMRSPNADYFTIAADARQLRFGLGEDNNNPLLWQHINDNLLLFDLARGTLASAPKPLPGFRGPSTEGLPVAKWEDGDHPTFAGRPIELDQSEQSHSLAIRADRTGFVLGTDFWLRAFDAQGRQLWQQPGPGVAWGVNLSADGRIVVVAYDDGTVRWLRWSDGKELLALFVDKADKRWVAWTPSGYYMASPGGEDLIGWHVNRGWSEAADFFPASRFRDRFNRSDIVELVLTTLDEDETIKQANEAARRKADTRPLIQHLPPTVRIAAPAADAHVQSDTLTLEYAVRSPSGQPVNRLDLLVNGRPVKSLGLPIKPLAPDVESTGSLQVTLTQHVSEVGLIAWSGDLASQAVQIKVTWDNAPAATRKLYALVIGVSDYADPAMALKYAAKDARDFATALAHQKGHYYVDVETRVLTDRDVTRASVIEGLQWLEKMATNPNDVTVLFLAGHGMTDDKQTYWFYTSNSNDSNVLINGVSQDELRKMLQGLQGKVLWFLDTCHAGTAAKRSPVDMNVLVNTVSASENGGIVVFASSTGRQVSVESADLGNGAFTKAVVEGIELGKADLLGDGFITTSTLDSYVVHRVGQFTDNQQTPVMERPPEEPDFAIAEVRK
jgi:dipeptidyl aminopeptidase/acylaminoacyl peptidase